MILRSLNKVVLHSISFSNYSGEAVRMRLKASKIDDLFSRQNIKSHHYL